MMATPKIYSLDDIDKVVGTPGFENELIDGIKEGFVALEKGDFFAAPIQTLGLPPFPFANLDGYAAQTCIKTGYFKGKDHYVVKVASGGYPMENSGLMQVYSQKTGKLEALLLDDGKLTELRTAACGALAVRMLAPKKIQMIGIAGTSVQARYQLNILPAVTDCKNVLVWGRTPAKVEALVSEMQKKGWRISAAATTQQLLQECDLIVTTTCAREAILGNNGSLEIIKRSGILISCIGADSPGKFELDPDLVAKADLLVADTVPQSVERGEFQKAAALGHIKPEAIVSLGNLIQQENLHRQKEGDSRLIIFDSSGVALQDCVISSLVVARARR